MAAKKKTTQKKTTTKTKKSSTKSKIKLMYSPVGFTAEYLSIPLRKKVTQEGTINLVNVPLIEGLPMSLDFKKGDTREVTPEQLQELRNLKVVESEEEHAARIAFIENLPNQYPEGLSEVERAERENALLTAWDAENKIYNDKLIICD
ncbi:MAG: hypothetical protein IJ672_09125 [Methanobrevibacter sp.]|nr:hypothetical protein [Methanobrevibacter sp.]